jgi:hypothetical protein
MRALLAVDQLAELPDHLRDQRRELAHLLHALADAVGARCAELRE